MSYASPDYLATLSHLGRRLDLPQAGGALYLRPLPTPLAGTDALGPYPWLACSNAAALHDDLGAIEAQALSVVAVLSPLRGAPSPPLRAAFADHLRPFKTHWACDFLRPLRVEAHHRRQARRAQAALALDIGPAAGLQDIFPGLYRRLAERHPLSLPARFFAGDLRRQLCLPEMLAAVARRDGAVVAAQLWMLDGDWAVYHLGASTDEGYRHAASHGLMGLALEHFRAAGFAGVWLGGSAGDRDDAQDGLARYKRGWSNREAQAWIGGRIGQRSRYRALCAGGQDTYFPAYRAPRKAESA